jgi:type I restriction-modification system DNA methylase subunit
MNPPFALRNNDEKEYKFISQALKQMQDGGILFSILPLSVMIERSTKEWRKNELLENNTLLSVITFPTDLFYPISVPTIGIIVKKGFKHPENQNVLWIRTMNDGFLKKKGVRLHDSTAQNDLEQVSSLVKNFINNPSTHVENIPEFQKACPINFDTNLELIPEEYLDEHILTEKEMMDRTEKLIRETVSFMIREGLE